MTFTTALYYSLATLAALYLVRFSMKKSEGAPFTLPPGPKGYPLVGNVYDIPNNFPWLKYAEWKQQYGDIVSFTVFGKTTIVLNSLKVALELLDKRSSNFSGRPRLVSTKYSLKKMAVRYLHTVVLTIIYLIRLRLMNCSVGSGILRICRILIAGGVSTITLSKKLCNKVDTSYCTPQAAQKTFSPILPATKSDQVLSCPKKFHNYSPQSTG